MHMPTSTQSIREIISTQSSAAAVLRRFDIDICSHANESLNQACVELQLSVDQVLEKLAAAEAKASGATSVEPASLTLSRLIQHIVRVHHSYVRQELPGLTEMARKLAAKHANRAPELKKVAELTEDLRADLFAHIQKEELVLFPFITQMEQDLPIASSSGNACFRSIAQPIFIMVQEHESAGRIVAELRRLTQDFEAPASACATQIALYGGLRAFDLDLKQHVHLENDILFPRAIEMESLLSARG
jgi:regulator of cell morphogenesis and NO signaling